MTEDNHAGIQLTQCTGLLAVMPYAILAACVVSAVGERTAPDLQMWALFDTNVGAGLPLVPFSLSFHCLVDNLLLVSCKTLWKCEAHKFVRHCSAEQSEYC